MLRLEVLNLVSVAAGLGNHCVASVEAESDQDLASGLLILPPQSEDVGVRHRILCRTVGRLGAAARTVAHWLDVLLKHVSNVLLLCIFRVDLHLIDSWRNFCVSQQIRQQLDVVVGHSNRLGEAQLDQALHLWPQHVQGYSIVDNAMVRPVNHIQVNIVELQFL